MPALFHFPYQPVPSEQDIRDLKNCISEFNLEAERAATIEEKSGGNHRIGHRLIQECFRRATSLMEREVWGDKKLKDLFTLSSSPLAAGGYLLLRHGYPIPFLMLARYEYASHAEAITEFVGGSDKAYKRFSPATGRLIADAGGGRRYVDAVALDLEMPQTAPDWRHWLLLDCFSQIVTRQHYLLEKNGYYDLAGIAGKVGLENVGAVLRLKIFCDHCHYPLPNRLRQSAQEVKNDAERFAFQGLVDPELVDSSLDFVAGPVLRIVEGLVAKEIITPFQKALAIDHETDGAMRHRSLASLVSGCPGQGGWLDEQKKLLAPMERRAGELLGEIKTLLRKKDGRKSRERLFLGIDHADLESSSSQRRLMSATHLQEHFEKFLDNSGIKERYEALLREPPNCPLPFAGEEPLALRLKAAVGAQLLADFKSHVLQLPQNLFQYDPDPALPEEANKANEAMYKHIGEMLHNRFVFEELLTTLPAASGILDGWLTFFEAGYVYGQCGIDSIERVLFPAFFFSDRRFAEIVGQEGEDFREPLSAIRRILRQIPALYRTKNWGAMRREVIEAIFKAYRRMHLRTTAELDKDGLVANPVSFSQGAGAFVQPQSHFSKTQLLVDEAAAPIQVSQAPPGSPRKYKALVDRNQGAIGKLRRIDSRLRRPCATIKRLSRTGPVFDDMTLPLYNLRENIYCAVDYRPRVVPGEKELVILLLDFSGSMGRERVAKAKDISVIIAEGLRHFDIRFYLYTTDGPLYDLMLIYNSRDKAAGTSGLASITANGTESGRGWNPDAAMLLTLKKLMEKSGDRRSFRLIHLGDHEYCKSLARQDLGSAELEMHYAVRRLTEAGHQYICARVGSDVDPYKTTDIVHRYIYFPEGILGEDKIIELHGLLQKDEKVGERGQ